MKILVFIESANGKIKKSSLELLSATAGNEVAALLIGDNVSSVAQSLKNYPVQKAFVFNNAALKDYNSSFYFSCFEQVIKKFSPELVLGSGSMAAKDLNAENNEMVFQKMIRKLL